MNRQAIYDRVRVMNKQVNNRLLIHIAGKQFGHFVILTHVGRKSGQVYRTPIIAEPIDGGFVIALTYGKKVDWLSNSLVKGTCSLYWKAEDYDLNKPKFIDLETGLNAFPSPLNRIMGMVGIEYYLRLSIV